MPAVSKLEVLGSTTCAGEYELLRSFCCQLRCKTMSTLPFPSDPLDRIHEDSGIINLRAEVNFMLSTKNLMKVQKPILLFKILHKSVLIILTIYWKYWIFFFFFNIAITSVLLPCKLIWRAFWKKLGQKRFRLSSVMFVTCPQVFPGCESRQQKDSISKLIVNILITCYSLSTFYTQPWDTLRCSAAWT